MVMGLGICWCRPYRGGERLLIGRRVRWQGRYCSRSCRPATDHSSYLRGHNRGVLHARQSCAEQRASRSDLLAAVLTILTCFLHHCILTAVAGFEAAHFEADGACVHRTSIFLCTIYHSKRTVRYSVLSRGAHTQEPMASAEYEGTIRYSKG